MEDHLYDRCIGANDAIALRFEGAPIPALNNDVAEVLSWFNGMVISCGLTNIDYVEELVDDNGFKWLESVGCYDDDVAALDCAPEIYSRAWAELREDWLCDDRIKGVPCETYWDGDGREDGRVRLSDTGKRNGFITLSDATCETVETFATHLENLPNEELQLTVGNPHYVEGTVSRAREVCAGR